MPKALIEVGTPGGKCKSGNVRCFAFLDGNCLAFPGQKCRHTVYRWVTRPPQSGVVPIEYWPHPACLFAQEEARKCQK